MALELKERLFTHLQQIVRDRDPYLATAGHFFVQQYIYQQLEKYGPVEIFEFTVRGKTHQNLILNLPGKQHGFPILVGAHYDAVPGTPGADDNATGVAVLLELARIFANEPAKHPLRLVAFDLEEYGLLGNSGASEYAAYLCQQNQQLRLMISLEMLGYCDSTPGSQQYPISLLKRLYPNCGNFIGLIGNLPTIFDLIYLSRSIRQIGVPSEWLPVFNKGSIVPQTRLSDHAHFWDRGYPAMMITDTAMLRNPHYHKASDTIETLNLDFLAGVCLGLSQGLRCL
ncbi:M28 family peptidase [Chroococcidiopsis sp. TS-821]|uniref:M28 family peptidase n=1 Tax=Chroococcidiopsis sp. TS-821 TaxID=1378066 RepID=UPI000CEE7B34|nr:M28 family peptidase [Chroococcidiopsis sp. TS-821]PPS45861.1 peptidase M28 [Chroococcidiopsis sp. TS-821]